MGQRLGQHFLANEKQLEKIAGALELENGDAVVEIGPGHGELTKEIVDKFKSLKVEKVKVVVIEKDVELADSLKLLADRGEFGNNFEIIKGDALKIIPDLSYKLKAKSYKLCGNIPYYITGHLLKIISELENKPELIVLVIQKEVAIRICSQPPKMNLLAAITQFWCEPEIIGFISKKDFNPPPEVDSAIIKLTPSSRAQLATGRATNNQQPITKEAEKYCEFARILFKQPRKTILNNLSFGFGGLKKEEIIQKLQKEDINPQDRPQSLPVAKIASLSTLF